MTISAKVKGSYFDLGTHSRPITVSSAEAQLWFDRGLLWCYGFNHIEAIVCFQRALEHDPECAMAWWGIAYARGPYYNRPWVAFGEDERRETVAACFEASQQALGFSEGVTPAELALIQALTRRYQFEQAESVEVLDVWMADYALAMAEVHKQFPDDLDIITLYAEAMLTRAPRQQWDLATGKPNLEADALAIINVLERGFRLMDESNLEPHPGVHHLYIHAVEISPDPERAIGSADTLRNLVPDAGHLQHMPAHIDVLCGEYQNVVVASDRAIAADLKYLERVPEFNFYTLSCCHDYHLKMFAAMLMGRYQTAVEAAEGIAPLTREEDMRSNSPYVRSVLEAYSSMNVHIAVRFGRWQEIIDEPMPDDPDLYQVATCMLHYAKAIACAALGNIEAAEEERRQFQRSYDRLDEERRFCNNNARDVLAVAAAMLNGELEYRKEHYDIAFDHLRRAVELDDGLNYFEPWAWMHPPRHALGALLLEQGHAEEAERIYRADLGLDDTLSRAAQHPNNVWSLHGYVECLNLRGAVAEAAGMQVRLDRALALTDIEITASCACRLHTAGCCDDPA